MRGYKFRLNSLTSNSIDINALIIICLRSFDLLKLQNDSKCFVEAAQWPQSKSFYPFEIRYSHQSNGSMRQIELNIRHHFKRAECDCVGITYSVCLYFMRNRLLNFSGKKVSNQLRISLFIKINRPINE